MKTILKKPKSKNSKTDKGEGTKYTKESNKTKEKDG
jgi:hypothetical protein